MIYYICTENHGYTIQSFLNTWGEELRSRITLHRYRDLLSMPRLPGGTYIFTDYDRLPLRMRRQAGHIADQLEAQPEKVRVLNHPRRSLLRYPLLKRLKEVGINRFDVHLPNAISEIRKFPVFVRQGSHHGGQMSELFHSRTALEDHLWGQGGAEGGGEAGRGRRRPGAVPPLIIEYCHTADATGVFRKYSVFRVGDRYVPRHLVFSRDWVVSMPDLLDEARIAEELAFLQTHPHESMVRQVFEIADIQYGRVDYAMLDGRMQVWEINSNPIVLLMPEEYKPEHLPHQNWFSPRVIAAFKAIDDRAHAARAVIPINHDLPQRPSR